MGELRLYNTLTRKEEPFVPREPGKVAMYACGLTPQAPAHVGHMRGVVVMDVVRRWLEQHGYEVHFVQNFTDIDDKIIRRAQEEGISTQQVAEKYSQMYIEDALALGVKLPHFVKVTENMQDIIAMVKKLVDDGYAYVVDGDVYFEVSKFPEYGKLSGRTVEELKAGARIEVDERKRHPEDFALWKSAKPGEPAWDSPWGPGRPGWHIECSALSLKYLQPAFDIHAGGMDLIFPHHENEIAQSEAYLNCQQPFARYWLHWGPVRLRQEKMSKSTGVVVPIRELRQQYEPAVIRFFLLTVHYRTPLEFSYERLDEAKAGLERIRTAAQRAEAFLRALPQPPVSDDPVAQPYREQFTEAMDNDFNTAQAIAVVFEVVREINHRLNTPELAQRPETAAELQGLLNALRWMMETVLGVPLQATTPVQSERFEQLMGAVIAWRAELRARKLYDLADRIRDDLKAMGIVLEDSPQGTTWRLAE
ncbi:MAG: cysteine--tRNA ligase [Fimbriimonadales bacterium]|jgi:cysteinyl-tRNA synthetase|nr:MAG: cysteine--tRNA ligase [Fimbriimonadales bacterium]CUU38536.1 cysteinyl-tRNA synthetase [Armatimonadetes bacterium GXS]